MVLEEFVKQLKDQIDKFEAHWKRQQEKTPPYPKELDLVDWEEQFIAFVELN